MPFTDPRGPAARNWKGRDQWFFLRDPLAVFVEIRTLLDAKLPNNAIGQTLASQATRAADLLGQRRALGMEILALYQNHRNWHWQEGYGLRAPDTYDRRVALAAIDASLDSMIFPLVRNLTQLEASTLLPAGTGDAVQLDPVPRESVWREKMMKIVPKPQILKDREAAK